MLIAKCPSVLMTLPQAHAQLLMALCANEQYSLSINPKRKSASLAKLFREREARLLVSTTHETDASTNQAAKVPLLLGFSGTQQQRVQHEYCTTLVLALSSSCGGL